MNPTQKGLDPESARAFAALGTRLGGLAEDARARVREFETLLTLNLAAGYVAGQAAAAGVPFDLALLAEAAPALEEIAAALEASRARLLALAGEIRAAEAARAARPDNPPDPAGGRP